MSILKLRLTGLALMILGGFLFVWAVRDISSEWPQIFTGLSSIFCLAIGFGLLLMPVKEKPVNPPLKND